MKCLLDDITSYLVKYDLARINSENVEDVSLAGQIIVSLLTTALCLVVYCLSALVFSIFSNTFRNLVFKEKMFWNLAVVRGVYGSVGTLMSIYVIWFTNFENIATTTTKESRYLNISHLGFFIFEWSAQILFDIKFKTFSQALHVHHFIAFVGYFSTVYYKTSNYLGTFAFILEASTPFSCICYCLIKAKMEDTFLWKANQIVLIHVFHIRSVLEATIIYKMCSNWEKFSNTPPILFWHTFISVFVVMIFLTPLWTYRKTKQLFEPKDWNTSEKPIEKTKKKVQKGQKAN